MYTINESEKIPEAEKTEAEKNAGAEGKTPTPVNAPGETPAEAPAAQTPAEAPSAQTPSEAPSVNEKDGEAVGNGPAEAGKKGKKSKNENLGAVFVIFEYWVGEKIVESNYLY